MHRESSTFSSPIPTNPNFPDHEHLKCPRCDSINTKFCYYNNYNLSQPRHFCKNCRRYWTKGGALRNIPIGGGSRKITKRSSNSTKITSLVTESVPEASVDRRFGDNSMGNFGDLLMEGSNFNLVSDESGEDVLVRRSIGGDFGSNLLRLNDDNSETGGGDRGLPELSIFTPDSRFH